MTQNERRLIRTCISNGFEFHSRRNDGKFVKVGDEEIVLDRLADLAVEIETALDKQTPMKPLFKEHTYEAYHCSVCGATVGVWNLDHETIIKTDYCQHCGQAVDWSDEK